MKRVSVAFAVAWVSASAVVGQTVPLPRPPLPPMPAEQLPAMHIPQDVIVETLPNGMTISRPLTPVTDPAIPQPQPGVAQPTELVPPRYVEQVRPAPNARPLPSTWYSGEYLLSWAKGQRTPPLVTANSSALPTLDDPNTAVLLGGRRADPMNIGGARFVLGWSAGEGSRVGTEIGYEFLGTQTVVDTVSGGGQPGDPILGRPLFNPRTGREDAVILSHANQLSTLDVSDTLRVQGWTAAGVVNLYDGGAVRLHGLLGYRYFMVNEGLRFDQLTLTNVALGGTVPGLPSSATLRTAATDQIDAHNRFHGAQIGLRTELNSGGFFATLDTKVSLGRTIEVVRISGQTVAVVDIPNSPSISYFPNGVFGQPSNAGRFSKSAFAVLPEAEVRVGYKYGTRSRFYVGYNFQYLSQVVRAGDQLDRVADLAQTTVNALTRPGVPFNRSDFWVQGVSFGLEWTY